MITFAYETGIIFKREFIARRDLLLAGLACAFLVLVLPLVPGISDYDATDVRLVAALGFAFAAGVVLAIGLGVSLFGRDLTECRLGFYFERPVSSTSIWVGRFSAVLLLIILCQAMILAAGMPWIRDSAASLPAFGGLLGVINLDSSIFAFAWFAGPPLLLLFVSHCLSIMLRDRSVWLALDLIVLSAAGVAIVLTLKPFVDSRFVEAGRVTALVMISCVLLATIVATAAGLVSGRTDPRRTHRALSLSLCAALGASLIGAAGYADRLLHFGPDEYDSLSIWTVSEDGSWIEVVGQAAGHFDVQRRFLLSADGEHRLSLPIFGGAAYSARTAADGSRTAWLAPTGDGRYVLWIADLRSAPPTAIETTITVPEINTYEISPDGTTVAFIEEDKPRLLLFDLSDERLLTVQPLSEDYRYHFPLYTNPTNLRVLEIAYQEEESDGTTGIVSFSDLAVERGASLEHRQTFHVPPDRTLRLGDRFEFVATGTRRESLGNTPNPPIQTLFDAANGSFIKKITGDFGGFLPGRRFWSLEKGADGSVSLVVDTIKGDGQPQRFEIGHVTGSLCIGPADNDTLFLATENSYHYDSASWDTIEILDLETGARHEVGKTLAIINEQETADWLTSQAHIKYIGRGRSPRLFVTHDDKNLMAWDSATKRFVTLAGGNAE